MTILVNYLFFLTKTPIVSRQRSFPIASEVFSGNTFEGHAITPVIKDFINEIT